MSAFHNLPCIHANHLRRKLEYDLAGSFSPLCIHRSNDTTLFAHSSFNKSMELIKMTCTRETGKGFCYKTGWVIYYTGGFTNSYYYLDPDLKKYSLSYCGNFVYLIFISTQTYFERRELRMGPFFFESMAKLWIFWENKIRDPKIGFYFNQKQLCQSYETEEVKSFLRKIFLLPFFR